MACFAINQNIFNLEFWDAGNIDIKMIIAFF